MSSTKTVASAKCPPNYFDTSALLKKYRREEGTLEVKRLVNEPQGECFISRLAVTEVQRTFAQLARENKISSDEADHLRAIFYSFPSLENSSL